MFWLDAATAAGLAGIPVDWPAIVVPDAGDYAAAIAGLAAAIPKCETGAGNGGFRSCGLYAGHCQRRSCWGDSQRPAAANGRTAATLAAGVVGC